MPYWLVDGKQLTHEEYLEYTRGIEEQQERKRQEAARLMKELGEAYKAYTQFMERNSELAQHVSDADAREHELYLKLRKNLEQADAAPRCEKVREDGTQCGCPQMKGHNYCYAHERMLQARAWKLELPALEDANSIQMAVMLVQRALIDDEISEKKAGLLLYSLQIAASNVKDTTFCEEDDEYLVTELLREEAEGQRTVRGRTVWSTRHEEAASTQQSAASQSNTLTTERRRQGKEGGFSGGLPPMSADSVQNTAQAGVPVPHKAGPAGVPVPHGNGAGQESVPAGEGACAPQTEICEPGMRRVSRLDIGMEGVG